MKTTTAIPVFQVSNVEASLKHYTGIFGFSEDFRFGDYAGIKLGDVRLHLSGHSVHERPVGGDAPGAAAGRANEGGGAVGEQRVGYDAAGVPAVAKVQAAQFHGTQQHVGRRLRAGEGAGDAQGVERTVAAHEAYMSPVDPARQAQAFE